MAQGKDAHPARRVLLKLSGEAFGGGSVGIDTAVIRRIAGEIRQACADGNQVAVVVGGGNFFRGAELSQAGLERARADYMGMLGTVMNCLDVYKRQSFVRGLSACAGAINMIFFLCEPFCAFTYEDSSRD